MMKKMFVGFNCVVVSGLTYFTDRAFCSRGKFYNFETLT